MISNWTLFGHLIILAAFLVHTQSAGDQQTQKNNERPQRFAHSSGGENGIFRFFMTLANIKQIYDDVRRYKII